MTAPTDHAALRDEIARAIWNARYQHLPDGEWEGALAIVRDFPDGAAARCVRIVRAEAAAAFAVIQADRAALLAAQQAVEAERDAANTRAAALAETVERLEAVLADAIRPSAIKLACGEMTAQEARTAYAVANYVAAKVRRALTPSEAPHAD